MTDLSDQTKHPISNVEWVDVNELRANSYNPNVVLTAEMKLLKLSLLKQGWIQPVLVSHDPENAHLPLEIIDGFHRFTLCKTDPEVNHLTGGFIPVVRLGLPMSERMMLTIRINRAKGNHMAIKMHEIVYDLHHVHGCSLGAICSGIGADIHEVNTLMTQNIFEKKDVENVPYSKAWIPVKRRNIKGGGGDD